MNHFLSENCRAKSFVTIMIVIALFALSLRIAIKEIMQITITRNESEALSTLKLVSTALENYAKDNRGVFAQSLSVLTRTSPPYLNRDSAAQFSVKGYNYSCPRLDESGYNCMAVPLKCQITGKNIFFVTTGGSLTVDKCSKKE